MMKIETSTVPMNNLHINMYVREKLDTFPRKGAVKKNRFIHDL